MKHVSFPVAGAAATSIGTNSKKSKPIGFLAWLVEALHLSRRLQAQRFLRVHRHLIAGDGDLKSNTGDDTHVDR